MMERTAFTLLCLLVFSIPWEKSVVVPGLGTLTKAIGFLTFAAGAAAVIQRRGIRMPNLAILFAGLFIFWSAMTWLWSYDRDATVVRTATYVQLLILMYLVWEFAASTARQTALMAAYVAGAVIAAAATIVRYSLSVQTYYRRYAAPGFDPNDLGLTIALALPLALYLLHRNNGRSRFLYIGSGAIICAAILLTASRTALVASYLAMLFGVLTWRRSTWLQRSAWLILLLLLTAGAVQFAPKATRQRISTIGTEIARGTLHNRTRIWKAGLQAVKRQALGGVGAGAYPQAVKPALGVPPIPGHQYVAHNAFLSVLVETGIIGFALFGGLLLTLAAFTYVMSNPERALWAVIMLVWAAGVFTLTWEHRKPTWLLFALLMTQWANAFACRPERED